jgi:hypothetical protein
MYYNASAGCRGCRSSSRDSQVGDYSRRVHRILPKRIFKMFTKLTVDSGPSWTSRLCEDLEDVKTPTIYWYRSIMTIWHRYINVSNSSY